MKNKAVRRTYSFFIYAFLYIPIIVLILFSFNESKLNAVWTGFSLKWYKNLINNYGILNAVKNSIVVALVSTIISVIIGTLASVGMYRYKFKGKSVLDAALYIPIVIPEIVLGIALLTFFSQVNLPRGIITLILAHITFSISYVVIVVRARLEGFDRALEEAAMDLGCTPLETFMKVTLPVIMPGIVAGGLLAFTLSLDDVIISFFVAGPDSMTLPLKVFSMVKFGVTPEINALSTILMIFTLSIVIFAERLKNSNMKSKNVLIILTVIIFCIAGFSGRVWLKGKSLEAQREELNVFNWSEYLPQSVIEKFEDTYNIKVNYSTFSSNEEMLAKLMAGGDQYDLVVASDYMVEVMGKQNILDNINKDKIPNYSNIAPEFTNLPFDKENKLSIPYMWLAGVIAVDSSKVKEDIKGYEDLWNSEYKNSLVVLDDQRVIIGMALKKLGYSINETDEDALQKAKEELKKLKPNIKAYDSDSPKTLLINGEAKIGFVWGAEASLAKRENKNIKFVIPKEGLFLQQDNFVIPKRAKNKKAAETFINFILDPKISAEISKAFPYANPNKEAYPLLGPEIMNDISIYPPKEALKKGEYLKDVGKDIKKFDEIWSEVK